MNRYLELTLLLAALILGGCASGPEPSTEMTPVGESPLGDPETYSWGGQPISFSPPPDGWMPQKLQSGGLRGTRFVKSGSVGEEVRVGEYSNLDRRDRCAALEELLDGLDGFSRHDMTLAVHEARLYALPPIYTREEMHAASANESLDRALSAFAEGDLHETRMSVREAMAQASHISYKLDQVVDDVIVKPDRLRGTTRFRIEEPVRERLAGEAALRVDYQIDYDGRSYRGREVYVVKNNRLFVVGFQGLAENLALFDRVASSVTFPRGECSH